MAAGSRVSCTIAYGAMRSTIVSASGTRYRVFDVGAAHLAVASPIGSFHAQLDAVYPYQAEIADDAFADVRVSLLPDRRPWPGIRTARLWSEGDCPFEPYPVDATLPLFEWGSNWLLAQRLNAHLLLHAGVVARDDKALILPATPGSGKTTLACALHLAGWRFLSDEFGVIDMARDEVLPMVRPAPLKNASIEVIRARPGARLGPLFAGTRKGDVAHFVADQASFVARHHPATPQLVIFPRYRSGAPLSCAPLDTLQAALGLGKNSFNYQALGPLGFDAVVRLARRTRAYRLEYGDLDEAIAHIDDLFARST